MGRKVIISGLIFIVLLIAAMISWMLTYKVEAVRTEPDYSFIEPIPGQIDSPNIDKQKLAELKKQTFYLENLDKNIGKVLKIMEGGR